MNDAINNVSLEIARNVARETDEAIGRQITAHIGEGWTAASILHRLSRRTYPNTPVEILCLDGQPFMEMWPVELETVREGDSVVMRATRKWRKL